MADVKKNLETHLKFYNYTKDKREEYNRKFYDRRLSKSDKKRIESKFAFRKKPFTIKHTLLFIIIFVTIMLLVGLNTNYLDKNVLISGEILEVCPMRGCWISVKNIESEFNIRVKVTDGEIVFPLSSKGKQVDVEGIFSKLEFSEEQAKQWKIHLSEEKGIELDPEDAVINPSDLIEYRIIGKSAKIYN